MAKNMQPVAKRCKALNISPAAMGYAHKDTKRNPKGQMRRKQSEYATQMNEKQKVKFVYGILEKQFRGYYEKALKAPGQTGENLLVLIERRLDNVAFRTGFCSTRRDARQAVTHGHFTVNGRRVNIPSYLVKPGDVIAISENSRNSVKFKSVKEEGAYCTSPRWMETDVSNLTARIVDMPAREDIDLPIEEHLIVELYSK